MMKLPATKGRMVFVKKVQYDWITGKEIFHQHYTIYCDPEKLPLKDGVYVIGKSCHITGTRTHQSWT